MKQHKNKKKAKLKNKYHQNLFKNKKSNSKITMKMEFI